MLSVLPYCNHFDEKLPAETGDEVHYWRIWEHAGPTFEFNNPKEWKGDFPSQAAAVSYSAFLARTESPIAITPAAAAKALDSLDDYASMDIGVNAYGPREALQQFIRETAITLGQHVPAGVTAIPRPIKTDADVGLFLNRRGISRKARRGILQVFPGSWRDGGTPSPNQELFLEGLAHLRLTAAQRALVVQTQSHLGVLAARQLTTTYLEPIFEPLAAEDV